MLHSAPMREPSARVARRHALGLGVLASLFAFVGRGTARAADALTIDANGVALFNGKRNFFTDEENAGNLRVGAAWNVPGIYSEKGPVVVGAQNGNIWLNGKVGIGEGKKEPSQSLDVAGTVAAENLEVAGTATAGGQFVGKGDAVLQKSLTLTGNLTAQKTAGANTLDIQRANRFNDHPTGLALYVTAESAPDSGGVEFRHSNASQGIGFGHNTIYATGSNANQDLILKARGTGSVRITGTLQARDFAATDANPLRNRMYPAEPVVYQDIFDALAAGAIQKIGTPSYDDTTYKGQSLWGDRHIIRFGGNNEADGNGAVVTIPPGYDTVWVRVLGERWNVIHAYFLDNSGDLGLWTGGFRSANSYAPDGTLADGYAAAHQWLPIPARGAGRLALISKSNTNKEFWISGLAFSKNPWGHAVQSAVGYHWAVNGGNATGWGTDNWNADTLAKIDPKTNLVLKVPVVPSGRDKLLYLIEHNSNWNGAMHTAITVEGQPVERFMATYDNPFSRHWNSKFYERYIATRIPNQYIPSNARFLNVVIDMTKQEYNPNDLKPIYFREIGAHDLAVPWP